MEYNELIKSHLKYGTNENDIKIRKGYKEILENVIIAPWWNHNIFNNMNFEIVQVSEKVFNFYNDELSFSYIELNSMGAPYIIDYVLSLGVTECKNLVFIGSAGSLDENIKIGDIVIPEYSICGDGASRYLNENLEDEFFKRKYPSEKFTKNLIDILNKKNIKYHYVPNYSIDTIFAQFYHIDKILALGAKTIEMETAILFKCNELLNINITALFCISDNTILNKSLYSGRTNEEKEYKHKVKYEVIPELIINLLKNNDN